MRLQLSHPGCANGDEGARHIDSHCHPSALGSCKPPTLQTGFGTSLVANPLLGSLATVGLLCDIEAMRNSEISSNGMQRRDRIDKTGQSVRNYPPCDKRYGVRENATYW